MALVSDGYQLTVGLIDNGRKQISMQFDLRATVHATVLTDVSALLADLVSVTDLEVTGYRITEVFIEDALTIPTILTAQAENIARVVLQLATSPLKKHTINIPGAKDTLFVGAVGTTGYDIVDVADTFLNNYTANFQAAGGTAYISDGEDAAAADEIIRGARVHRGTTLKNPG